VWERVLCKRGSQQDIGHQRDVDLGVGYQVRTKSSGIRFVESQVKFPWLLRDVFTLEEDEFQSSGANVVENENGPLR